MMCLRVHVYPFSFFFFVHFLLTWDLADVFSGALFSKGEMYVLLGYVLLYSQ